MILAIRTDKPEAQLYLLQDTVRVKEDAWYAHRELSDTLLQRIEALLAECNIALGDLEGIVVYQGPGSFTGLRIGIAVANTLAYALAIPIVGAVGEAWQRQGVTLLKNQHAPQVIIPQYGQEANITAPKK